MRFGHCVILRPTAICPSSYRPITILLCILPQFLLLTQYIKELTVLQQKPHHTIYNTNIYLELPKVTNTTQHFGNCSLLNTNLKKNHLIQETDNFRNVVWCYTVTLGKVEINISDINYVKPTTHILILYVPCIL